MKFKYINEDMSEKTRLKKIETLTKNIEKLEVQVQKAQKQVDDVVIFKDPISNINIYT